MRWKRAPSFGLACNQSNSCWPFNASNAMPPASAPSSRLQISPLYSVSNSADVRIEFGASVVSILPSGVSENFPPAPSLTMPQVESARSRR